MGFTHLDPESDAFDALCSNDPEVRRSVQIPGLPRPIPPEEPPDEPIMPSGAALETCAGCREVVPYETMDLVGTDLMCPECASMSPADWAFDAMIRRAEDRRDEREV